ncbi:hypothetical protein [Streptomyces iconiensis]|uniref:Lipoprotein n=1 Tax=Streptomyces iconiensis TaxID=1384038 RepID=A0ABT7A873_9ACTN|nr:hypothetical protein [Streptomyces iconiensis]MDJ1137511.1 hypothetical protein [Streptomyces iconiensis]
MHIIKPSAAGRLMLITACVTALGTGGCMSEKSEINKPLPRMSEKGAEDWARHFTQSMARSAQIEIDGKTVKPNYTKCVGKNDEVPEDGRFVLQYDARAPLDGDQHEQAIKRIQAALKERGYKTDGYQVTKGSNATVTLNARDPKKGFTLAIDGFRKRNEIVLTVITPCLLPPGKEQQQY